MLQETTQYQLLVPCCRVLAPFKRLAMISRTPTRTAEDEQAEYNKRHRVSGVQGKEESRVALPVASKHRRLLS
jgi:hypothetical protein